MWVWVGGGGGGGASGVGHCPRFTFCLAFLKNPSIMPLGVFLDTSGNHFVQPSGTILALLEMGHKFEIRPLA